MVTPLKLSELTSNLPFLNAPRTDKNEIIFHLSDTEEKEAIESFLDAKEIPYQLKEKEGEYDCHIRTHVIATETRPQLQAQARPPLSHPADATPAARADMHKQLLIHESVIKTFFSDYKEFKGTYVEPVQARVLPKTLSAPASGKQFPKLETIRYGVTQNPHGLIRDTCVKSLEPRFTIAEQQGFFIDMQYNTKTQHLIIKNVHNYLDKETYHFNTTDFLLYLLSAKGQVKVPLKMIVHLNVINSPIFIRLMNEKEPKEQKSRRLLGVEEIREFVDEGKNNISMTVSLLSKAWEVTKEELIETMPMQVQGLNLLCGIDTDKIYTLRKEIATSIEHSKKEQPDEDLLQKPPGVK